MGQSRQSVKPARPETSPTALALAAAALIPVACGIVIAWRMAAAGLWERPSLFGIVACVVAAAALVVAALAARRDPDSTPGASGFLLAAALAGALALAVIAVTPWLV